MIAYFGNEIQLYSGQLSYCIYESNWIEQSEADKKLMIIFCEILKQPHELVVAKLYPLNLDTFTTVMFCIFKMDCF